MCIYMYIYICICVYIICACVYAHAQAVVPCDRFKTLLRHARSSSGSIEVQRLGFRILGFGANDFG